MSTDLLVRFVTQECCKCHMAFAVPADFNDRRLDDHQSFYCPQGHSQYYTGKSEAEKLKDRVASLESSLQYQREARQSTERRLIAQKGLVTRIKNRVGKGVCPCCNRTFENVAKHMKSQHPEFAKAE